MNQGGKNDTSDPIIWNKTRTEVAERSLADATSKGGCSRNAIESAADQRQIVLAGGLEFIFGCAEGDEDLFSVAGFTAPAVKQNIKVVVTDITTFFSVLFWKCLGFFSASLVSISLSLSVCVCVSVYCSARNCYVNLINWIIHPSWKLTALKGQKIITINRGYVPGWELPHSDLNTFSTGLF